MNKKLEAQLCKDFPLLFADKDKDIKESLMRFGCECRDGWYDLIHKACEELEPLLHEWIKENPTVSENCPRFVQIKEKFGTLCLYLTYGTNELYAVTSKYEKMSATICEMCGSKEAKLRGRNTGWYYTACIKCTKTQDLDNLAYVAEMDAKKKGGKYCPTDCGGCQCHLFPPCSHCVDHIQEL